MKRALLMIGGEYHLFESCGQILSERLQQTGACHLTITSDRRALTALSSYDLVIVYTQGGTLTEEQEDDLCGFVESGGGLIGIHCASDSFLSNERYLEMLGCRFITHPRITEFEIKIVDHDHDITRRCPDFRVTDEFYMLEMKGAPVHLLASAKWQFETHPMAYAKQYGQGHVFYVAAGHDERTFGHSTFQKLLFRAVRWVTLQPEGRPV